MQCATPGVANCDSQSIVQVHLHHQNRNYAIWESQDTPHGHTSSSNLTATHTKGSNWTVSPAWVFGAFYDPVFVVFLPWKRSAALLLIYETSNPTVHRAAVPVSSTLVVKSMSSSRTLTGRHERVCVGHARAKERIPLPREDPSPRGEASSLPAPAARVVSLSVCCGDSLDR